MQLQEVNNKKTAREFLDVSRELYKNDKAWVCPLDQDINNTFDPEQNNYYSHGEAIRWIMKDESGKTIGRIAAFINENKADFDGKRGGGIGFFECIENKEAAFLLFDKAMDWLRERKVNYVMGPINFGENDTYWGLLVEGFTHPSYGMTYNHPYYKGFFEDYGFTTKMEQLTNHVDVTAGIPPRFKKIGNYVLERRKNVTIKHFEMRKFDQFADDFISIYNRAWSNHENFTPVAKEYIKETFKKIKPIYEPKFIWFAYVNGDPASFVLCLPDVNQIFKHLNGKLHFWNKLKFVWLKRRKVIDRIRVIVMGTAPEYQGMGLESVVTLKCFERAEELGHFVQGELSWVGDFNDKMLAIHKALGGAPGKKHITYEMDI